MEHKEEQNLMFTHVHSVSHTRARAHAHTVRAPCVWCGTAPAEPSWCFQGSAGAAGSGTGWPAGPAHNTQSAVTQCFQLQHKDTRRVKMASVFHRNLWLFVIIIPVYPGNTWFCRGKLDLVVNQQWTHRRGVVFVIHSMQFLLMNQFLCFLMFYFLTFSGCLLLASISSW